MYAYKNQEHVEVRVARIFNTFGPRMHPNDGRVVSNFIIQALQGKDITIYGEGKQTRSFQYVDDLVQRAEVEQEAVVREVSEAGIFFAGTILVDKLRISSKSTVVGIAKEDKCRRRSPGGARGQGHLGQCCP